MMMKRSTRYLVMVVALVTVYSVALIGAAVALAVVVAG